MKFFSFSALRLSLPCPLGLKTRSFVLINRSLVWSLSPSVSFPMGNHVTWGSQWEPQGIKPSHFFQGFVPSKQGVAALYPPALINCCLDSWIDTPATRSILGLTSSIWLLVNYWLWSAYPGPYLLFLISFSLGPASQVPDSLFVHGLFLLTSLPWPPCQVLA